MPGLVPLLAVVLAAHAPVVAGPTKSGARMALRMPSAAQQCGWSDSLF